MDNANETSGTQAPHALSAERASQSFDLKATLIECQRECAAQAKEAAEGIRARNQMIGATATLIAANPMMDVESLKLVLQIIETVQRWEPPPEMHPRASGR